MKDNKYFCYTIYNGGERGYQRIDKEYAIQLNNMGRWFYKLPFKVVNSLTKALRWKYHLRDYPKCLCYTGSTNQLNKQNYESKTLSRHKKEVP